MLSAALHYHEAGLKVVPVYRSEEGQIAFAGGWEKYRQGQSREDVERAFTRPQVTTHKGGAVCQLWGLAILCTDGMEVIDIDTKQDPKRSIDREYFDEVVFGSDGGDLLGKCVIVSTKSGGKHIVYRADNVDGNKKLASRKENPKEAVIETRGRGGLIFAFPTPGYELEQGSYTVIPKLSDNERDELINAALRLNEVVEPVRIPRPTKRQPSVNEGLTPWDDYDQQTDVRALVEAAGWKQVRENPTFAYYNRPGAKNPRGIDASVHKSDNYFYPFSTSTQFEAQKGYGPYAFLAVDQFGGDFAECARSLREQGYGEQMTAPVEGFEQARAEQIEKKQDDLLSFLRSTRFSIKNPPKEEAATLHLHNGGRTYKIGGRGMMGAVVGKQKSGKSLITSCITASALGGGRQLGLEYQSQGKRKIFFDTEQSLYFYGKTQQRIYQLAGLRDDPSTYETYHLRRLSIPERVEAIELILSQPGEIELVVIDGVVDLCTNFNEEKPSIATVEKLMQWSDRTGAMLLTVLHTTKAAGYMRGHLGTALQNKVDFAFEVSRDPELNSYEVSCRESRFAPFDSFHFYRDEYGMPYLEGDEPDQDDPADYDQPEPAYNPTITAPVEIDTEQEIPF